MQDGEYGRISMGKHNSIFIGGVAHELGHALSLPHNKERPDEVRRVWDGTDGQRQSHVRRRSTWRRQRYFSYARTCDATGVSSSVQRFDARHVRTRIGELRPLEFTEIDGGFRVSGVVSSVDADARGHRLHRPRRWWRLRRHDAGCRPRSERQVSRSTALPSTTARPGELRLVACHVNGKTTQRGFGYRVGRQRCRRLVEHPFAACTRTRRGSIKQ